VPAAQCREEGIAAPFQFRHRAPQMPVELSAAHDGGQGGLLDGRIAQIIEALDPAQVGPNAGRADDEPESQRWSLMRAPAILAPNSHGVLVLRRAAEWS
jgi:hypothetical protein